jgi:tetratricopeptide (TPR) repeat protein/outer membrane protein assembly factor BamB
MDWLRRTTRQTDDSRAIAAEAALAEEQKRWPVAEELFRRALNSAQSEADEFNLAYLEGRLANALLRQGRLAEAKLILERSIARPSEVRIPGAVSMLTEIYLDEGQWQRAEDVLREGFAAQATREERAGRSRPDTRPAVLTLADAGAKASDPEPIARAERWASELGDRELWFAASHRRGQVAEEAGDIEAAVAHYRWLADEGSPHEATYARLFILLERAGQHEEALARAKAVLERRWSASFEEQTRKRMQRIESRLAPRGRKPPRQVIAAFSVREGDDLLAWLGQLDVKGGAQSVVPWQDGLLVQSSGGDAALFAVGHDLAGLERLRPMQRGSSVLISPGRDRALLVTNEGRVAEGRATIAGLSADWEDRHSTELGGVTSEFALLDWGIGAGSRDGGLYAVDWEGRSLWTYRLSADPDADAYSRRCPYYVNGAPSAGRVVFSSWSEVMCLEEQGQVAWMWTIPPQQREWRTVYPVGRSVADIAAAAGVLGVATEATEPEIRAAFRRRAKETHPDTTSRSPADFVAVREAYEAMLGGPSQDQSMPSFTMTMAAMVTTVRATQDGGAYVGGSNGHVFRLDAHGRVLLTQPGSDQSAWLLTDSADRLAAVSDWDGVTIFGADGHPVGGHPVGHRLDLRLSENEDVIAGYSKRDLYFFGRSGALLSHVEFSRPIADLAWLDEVVVVAAGKLVALSIKGMSAPR